MKLSMTLIALFTSTIALSAPAISAAPAGKKIHKEIKSGQVVAPTTPPTAVVNAKPVSADKTKTKK